jgi:hypothetical protein
LKVFRILHIEKAGAAPDHEDLTDLLFEGQLVEGLLSPLLSSVREMNRARALILVFPKSCGGSEKS